MGVDNRVLQRFMARRVSVCLVTGEGYTGYITDVDGPFFLFKHGSQEIMLAIAALARCFDAPEIPHS